MTLLHRLSEIIKKEGLHGTLSALLRYFTWHPVIDILYWYIWCLFTFKTQVIRNISGHKMKLEPWLGGIHRHLFLYGIHEKESSRIISSIISAETNVVDIGGNIGYFTLIEAKKAGKVYVLEPSPGNIRLLRENIALNSYQNHVEVFELAASDKNGRSRFSTQELPNHHRLLGTEEEKSSGWIEVQTITLDELSREREIDFIRMDVEGAEWLIIQGMKELITGNRKPLSIFMEVHANKIKLYGGDAKSMFDFLFEHGFHIRHIIGFGYKHGYSKYLPDYFMVKAWPPQYTPEITIPAENQANDKELRWFLENKNIYCLLLER